MRFSQTRSAKEGTLVWEVTFAELCAATEASSSEELICSSYKEGHSQEEVMEVLQQAATRMYPEKAVRATIVPFKSEVTNEDVVNVEALRAEGSWIIFEDFTHATQTFLRLQSENFPSRTAFLLASSKSELSCPRRIRRHHLALPYTVKDRVKRIGSQLELCKSHRKTIDNFHVQNVMLSAMMFYTMLQKRRSFPHGWDEVTLPGFALPLARLLWELQQLVNLDGEVNKNVCAPFFNRARDLCAQRHSNQSIIHNLRLHFQRNASPC